MSNRDYFAADSDYAFERERLTLLEQVFDDPSIRRLSALGVGRGWSCLEVGAGGGSIARWLAKRVGPEGKVLATDVDLTFIGKSDAPNLTIRQHDILVDDLEEGQYDLVHCRLLLMHLREPHKGLERMAAAVRPGGWLLIEELDYGLYDTARPEHAAAEFMDNLTRTVQAALQKSGIIDVYFGRRVRGLMEGIGFVDVGHEGVVRIRRGGEPQSKLALMTFQLGARRLIAAGIVTEEDYARCQRVSEDSSYYAAGPVFFGAWGRRPV